MNRDFAIRQAFDLGHHESRGRLVRQPAQHAPHFQQAFDHDCLVLWRRHAGLGLGGQLPVAVTLVSEYIPAQVRGRFIVLLESFWGLGWLCAALISYFIIPHYDWHAAFLVGGLPALYAIVIW